MILKRLQLNTNLGEPTNCYIIMDKKTRETMIIDPGAQPEKVIDMITILGARVKYIYLTHCHGDHIGAVTEVKNASGGKILIHRFDSENINNPQVNLSDYIGIKPIELETDSRIDDYDLLHLGDIEFEVIHTPGHTKGGTCLYCREKKLLFSGDTLFRGTWGRTDLPTGGIEEIMNSIMNRILVLEEDTIVYPGHGKATMLHEEKTIYLELKPKEF